MKEPSSSSLNSSIESSRSKSHDGMAIVVLVLVSFSLLPSVIATEVSATSSVILNCVGGTNVSTSGEHQDAACSGETVYVSGSVYTAASVDVSLGAGVRVLTNAVSTSEVENINPIVSYASSYISLDYYFSIDQADTTPVNLQEIPLLFAAAATVLGIGDADHEGFLGVRDYNGIHHGISYFSQETEVEFSFADNYIIGEDYQISIESYCDSIVSGVDQASCTARSFATLIFDQDTFDDLMGDDSFLLSDYFQITYSPNLVSIPVPAALLLMISGIGLLSWITKRKLF